MALLTQRVTSSTLSPVCTNSNARN